MQNKKDKITKKFIWVAIGILALVLGLRLFYFTTQAGSLTPSASPTSTMRTTEEIYNPLVGTFNSSGITASSTGSALQISQCIITKINGGNCP